METIRRSFDSVSIPRRRSNSASASHSSPPSIYPSDVAEDTIPVIRPPPRPTTSASTRPPHFKRAYVVVGSTQSCVAILSAPRPGPTPTTATGTPINTTKSAPASLFPTRPRTVQRTRSSGSLQRDMQRENLEKYLRGTKTVAEYRLEMEKELIRRNREREREKESSWSRVVGRMKKKILDDAYENVTVVYMTAEEAAEREWQIRSQIKSKALTRV